MTNCKCFRAWRKAWAPDGSREDQAAIEQVRAFIQTHEARFECKKFTPMNRAGYLKEDGSEYWIYPAIFKDEVCQNLRSNTVAKALVKAGFLKTDSAGKRSITRRPELGGPPQRFYVISEQILEAETEQ